MHDTTKKEIIQLSKYRVFCALKKGAPVPAGYKQIPYHTVFDIKFNLRHKACLLANSNWTDATRKKIYFEWALYMLDSLWKNSMV